MLILSFIKSCCLCTLERSKSLIRFCFRCCSLKKQLPVCTAGTSLDFGTEPFPPLLWSLTSTPSHSVSLPFSLSLRFHRLPVVSRLLGCGAAGWLAVVKWRETSSLCALIKLPEICPLVYGLLQRGCGLVDIGVPQEPGLGPAPFHFPWCLSHISFQPPKWFRLPPSLQPEM